MFVRKLQVKAKRGAIKVIDNTREKQASLRTTLKIQKKLKKKAESSQTKNAINKQYHKRDNVVFLKNRIKAKLADVKKSSSDPQKKILDLAEPSYRIKFLLRKEENAKTESNEFKKKAYVSKTTLVDAKKHKLFDRIPNFRKNYEYLIKKASRKAHKAREAKINVNSTIKDFYFKNEKNYNKAWGNLAEAKKNYASAQKSKAQDQIKKTQGEFKKASTKIAKFKAKTLVSKKLVNNIKDKVKADELVKKDINKVEKSGTNMTLVNLLKKFKEFDPKGEDVKVKLASGQTQNKKILRVTLVKNKN